MYRCVQQNYEYLHTASVTPLFKRLETVHTHLSLSLFLSFSLSPKKKKRKEKKKRLISSFSLKFPPILHSGPIALLIAHSAVGIFLSYVCSLRHMINHVPWIHFVSTNLPASQLNKQPSYQSSSHPPPNPATNPLTHPPIHQPVCQLTNRSAAKIACVQCMSVSQVCQCAKSSRKERLLFDTEWLIFSPSDNIDHITDSICKEVENVAIITRSEVFDVEHTVAAITLRQKHWKQQQQQTNNDTPPPANLNNARMHTSSSSSSSIP